ncbi:MAG: hypothetical protein HQ517_11550, partial [SAR324 cluster bacterium]|nr:hypothetical protein [SAR324 cluster bacterium]
MVQISPVQIEWNADAQLFHAYFDVTNKSDEDVDLTNIIIFKIGWQKRWRGTHLPIVRAKQTDSFKITFAPGIMLKNEYISITVNIYGKDYKGLLDFSARYLKISSRRVIIDGKTRIELVESVPKTIDADSTPKIRMIQLGPEDSRMRLLATERFQNVSLESVSPEEKRLLT